MPISIDHATRIIFVPQSFLTLVSGTNYELDVNAFRLALKNLEDDANGIQLQDTHRHNAEVSLGGITLAQTVEIINGYTVTFEDGFYSVNLIGANNNIIDVTNFNSVSVRSNNSAGLVVVTDSAITQSDKDEIIAGVWRGLTVEAGLTPEEAMRLVLSALVGKLSGVGTGTVTFRDAGDTKDRIVATVDAQKNRVSVTTDPS